MYFIFICICQERMNLQLYNLQYIYLKFLAISLSTHLTSSDPDLLSSDHVLYTVPGPHTYDYNLDFNITSNCTPS